MSKENKIQYNQIVDVYCTDDAITVVSKDDTHTILFNSDVIKVVLGTIPIPEEHHDILITTSNKYDIISNSPRAGPQEGVDPIVLTEDKPLQGPRGIQGGGNRVWSMVNNQGDHRTSLMKNILVAQSILADMDERYGYISKIRDHVEKELRDIIDHQPEKPIITIYSLSNSDHLLYYIADKVCKGRMGAIQRTRIIGNNTKGRCFIYNNRVRFSVIDNMNDEREIDTVFYNIRNIILPRFPSIKQIENYELVIDTLDAKIRSFSQVGISLLLFPIDDGPVVRGLNKLLLTYTNVRSG